MISPAEPAAALVWPILRLLFTLEGFKRPGSDDPDQPWNEGLRDGLLEFAYRTASSELFVPVQDVFGWRDRINQPATIGDDNWTWRMPWPCDRLSTESDAISVASQLHEWSATHGRL